MNTDLKNKFLDLVKKVFDPQYSDLSSTECMDRGQDLIVTKVTHPIAKVVVKHEGGGSEVLNPTSVSNSDCSQRGVESISKVKFWLEYVEVKNSTSPYDKFYRLASEPPEIASGHQNYLGIEEAIQKFNRYIFE